MKYQLNKDIKDNDEVRAAFNELAVRVFDLSFEDWYSKGYWTDKYIPYVLMDGKRVIANASVNIMSTIWNNQPKRYIQIGTVMTDIEYRNQGLSRFLIQEILKDWKDRCDAIYLLANDTVLDFYPKFGFKKEIEYQCRITIAPGTGNARKLDMENNRDRKLLETYYQKSNPFSRLPMVDNFGLLMFYGSAFMKDCIYYSEDFDGVVVAMQDGRNLICFDIYSDGDKSMPDILSTVAKEETDTVIFEFTPKDTEHCIVSPMEGECTLFVWNDKENIFTENQLMVPSLSHA